MAWSTRELAELAGTTVRAVRHYHAVGLLEEPRRRTNGYKEYGVAHLVRTVRIRRLTDLGFSLAQVAEMGDADEHPHEALENLRTELAQNLERLHRVRTEVAQILALAAPTDLPPGLSTAIGTVDLSDADRSLLVVMSRVLEPDLLMGLVDLLKVLPADPATHLFDELPADADETLRRDLADQLFSREPAVLALLPGVLDATGADTSDSARRTIGRALDDLYNPAQVDVLRRVRRLRLASRPVRPRATSAHTSTMPQAHGLLPTYVPTRGPRPTRSTP
ncbi:MAG: MerR family transcriptional regulator [Kineosporiaceae bacterium]